MCKSKKNSLLVLIVFTLLLFSCNSTQINKEDKTTKTEKGKEMTEQKIEMAKEYKKPGNHNPLMTQRFGADPWALVYEDRVYIYMTGDALEKDSKGNVTKNTYSKIKHLNVISSDDLVNWTDHGFIRVAGPNGAARWAHNSWAPAAAWKMIDGKPKFFLYFADGGGGIGVLEADSPTGPFIDPIGKGLITRNTPNCANVSWLFDPAVLVDDDGTGWIYFGGGPGVSYEAPGTGRVCKLGNDMISLASDPVPIDAPYIFEDSGINKMNGRYYYSYCSNWNVPEGKAFGSGQIMCMESDNPDGPFVNSKMILKNPGTFFGTWGNNHHCIFTFKDKTYIAYHSQMLERPMQIEGGYRSTNIDRIDFSSEQGFLQTKGTYTGVEQVKAFNPYNVISGATIGAMCGIETNNGKAVAIDTGDWIMIYGADFTDNGATSLTLNISPEENTNISDENKIEFLIDLPTGKKIRDTDLIPLGSVTFKNINQEESVVINLADKIYGTHDIIFRFTGNGWNLDNWKFNK